MYHIVVVVVVVVIVVVVVVVVCLCLLNILRKQFKTTFVMRLVVKCYFTLKRKKYVICLPLSYGAGPQAAVVLHLL